MFYCILFSDGNNYVEGWDYGQEFKKIYKSIAEI